MKPTPPPPEDQAPTQQMDRDKVDRLVAVDAARYKDVDIDHLMMYAIGQLELMGAELSLENATVAAFRLFPEKFALLGYPGHPDSNRVSKCLWRLSRDKKRMWLDGRVRRGFTVSERGRRVIEDAETRVSGASLRRSRAKSQTRRKEVLMTSVIATTAYRKYVEGQRELVTEADFCFALQGTLESSSQTLRDNLRALQQLAAELDRPEVVEFLDWLSVRFGGLLGRKSS